LPLTFTRSHNAAAEELGLVYNCDYYERNNLWWTRRLLIHAPTLARRRSARLEYPLCVTVNIPGAGTENVQIGGYLRTASQPDDRRPNATLEVAGFRRDRYGEHPGVSGSAGEDALRPGVR
jgi:hypothetical protein